MNVAEFYTAVCVDGVPMQSKAAEVLERMDAVEFTELMTHIANGDEAIKTALVRAHFQ